MTRLKTCAQVKLEAPTCVMMHRSLSTGVETGSSFRMTQLLLPHADTATIHDSGTSERSRRRTDQLLPQLLDMPTSSENNGPRRDAYTSQDNYSDTSWQSSVGLDTIDYRQHSAARRQCSIYRNTSGQSPQLALALLHTPCPA